MLYIHTYTHTHTHTHTHIYIYICISQRYEGHVLPLVLSYAPMTSPEVELRWRRRRRRQMARAPARRIAFDRRIGSNIGPLQEDEVSIGGYDFCGNPI